MYHTIRRDREKNSYQYISIICLSTNLYATLPFGTNETGSVRSDFPNVTILIPLSLLLQDNFLRRAFFDMCLRLPGPVHHPVRHFQIFSFTFHKKYVGRGSSPSSPYAVHLPCTQPLTPLAEMSFSWLQVSLIQESRHYDNHYNNHYGSMSYC